MTEYGLTGASGQQEFDYEWDNQEITIVIDPPTLDQMERYEDLGEDVASDRLREIIDAHIVEPDKDPGDMTMREINCYLEGIMRHGAAGQNGSAAAAAEYLEEHGGSEGN